MTKQDFLDGKEFKTFESSQFTYKYFHNTISCKYLNNDFSYEGSVGSITDIGFTAFTPLLGEIFTIELKFDKLITLNN